MKRFLKIIAMLILTCMLIPVSLPVNAARAQDMIEHGFNVPTTGYNFEIWSEETIVIKGFYLGNVIGKTVITVARARSKLTDGNGKYSDTLFVCSQMDPKVVKKADGNSGYVYYRGMNFKSEAYMKLNSNQTYVNYAPESTMPDSSSTWDISISAGLSDEEWGFNIGTGYTSTTRDNCFTVATSIDPVEGEYDITYNYRNCDNFFGTAARRAINLWCTRSHRCYYLFKYKTPSGNTNNIRVTFNSRFRLAKNYGITWNGGTWDVENKYSGYNGATVTFPNSN